MDIDQTSYAGFVDGSYWEALIACFQEWAERHHQVTARRMAETADDVPNDLVMALFEICELDLDEQFDRDGECYSENTHVWRAFDAMCERFATDYQPKDATEFVSDLIARLTDAPAVSKCALGFLRWLPR